MVYDETQILFLTACFLKDMDIPGPTVTFKNLNNMDAVKCQQHCQVEPQCVSFVYMAPSMCAMKDKILDGNTRATEGFVSGPKFCSGG